MGLLILVVIIDIGFDLMYRGGLLEDGFFLIWTPATGCMLILLWTPSVVGVILGGLAIHLQQDWTRGIIGIALGFGFMLIPPLYIVVMTFQAILFPY